MKQRWRTRAAALLVGVGLAVVVPELIARVLDLRARHRYLVPETIGGQAGLRARASVPGLPVRCSVTPFTLRPAPGVLRIGAFGESTVAGLPFEPPFTIWLWLGLELEARTPGTKIEALAFGLGGADIRHVRQLAEEVPRGALDLAIVWAGDNEFLDVYATRARRLRDESVLGTAARWCFDQRFPSWLLQGVLGLAPLDDTYPLEPLVDRFTSDATHLALTDRMRAAAATEYRALVAHLSSLGIPVLCVLPPSNLRATTPRLSFVDPTLPATDRGRGIELGRAAEGALWRGDAAAALTLAEQAGALLPGTGWTHGVRCRSLAALGREAEALEAQRMAESLDLLPQAPTAILRSALREVALAQGVWVLDADACLRSLAARDWDAHFVDYVHPSIEGQIELAHALSEELRARGWPRPAAKWSDGYRPPEELLARGRTESARAAGVAVLMGLCYIIEAGAPAGALRAAEPSLREALAHTPDDAHVLFAYGLAELLLGKEAEGDLVLRRSFAADAAMRDLGKALAQRSAIVQAAIGKLLDAP